MISSSSSANTVTLNLLTVKCHLTGRLKSYIPDSSGPVPSPTTGCLGYEVSNRARSGAIFILPTVMIPFLSSLFGLIFSRSRMRFFAVVCGDSSPSRYSSDHSSQLILSIYWSADVSLCLEKSAVLAFSTESNGNCA